MTDFLLKIPTIKGESDAEVDAIECSAMRHSIELPVLATGSDRTEGAAKHGAIELRKSIDKATPGLRYAAASGTNLGTVTIKRKRTGGAVAEIIELQNAFVVRYDLDTPYDPEAKEPGGDFAEIVALEYSRVSWTLTPFVNNAPQPNVVASYDVSTQTSA